MISELSRFRDFNKNQQAVIANAAITYGVNSQALGREITNQISTMPAVEYARASNWYFDANTFASTLAEKYGTTTEIVAGIVAAVSPRMPWLRNKNIAEAILSRLSGIAALSADDGAKVLSLGIYSNVSMAIKIGRGADISRTLGGIKRQSFYNNIAFPSQTDSVTIDTWMLMAFCKITGKDKNAANDFLRANRTILGGTGAGYIIMADAVRAVANNSFALHPHQVQAAYWVGASQNYNGGAIHTK